MTRARVTAWVAYTLVLFGCLLILNQDLWPTKAEWDLLGVAVRTTFVGLAAIMVGAVVLLSLVEKHPR